METGTLKMLSEMAPWGSATNKNMSMQRSKYSCIQGDSSHWVLARMWLWNKGTEHNPMMFLIFYSIYTTIRGSISLKLQKCRGHLILSSWIICHQSPAWVRQGATETCCLGQKSFTTERSFKSTRWRKCSLPSERETIAYN